MKRTNRAPRLSPKTTANLFLQLLPFADAATKDLPLTRLLRLSLFQVAVGMTMVLLTGTLNRVMIVELGVPAGLVALMVSLPLILAPVRALIGFRSDTHRSFLGWRRVPYIGLGAMLTYGGLAIMPFALLNLSDGTAPPYVGEIASAVAFLLAGAGVHMTQTAGLALAADLSDDDSRPRVIALLYVMLLVGMFFSAIILGQLLTDPSPKVLIQVIQGCAVVVIVLNHIALWKQEPRNMALTAPDRKHPTFWQAWTAYRQNKRPYRLLAAVGLGAAAFGMQDILLEPYGGEVLKLSVSQTTALTAFMAGGSLLGFMLAARLLSKGHDACRLAAFGAVFGVGAFAGVILSGPLGSVVLFQSGTFCIGFGSGLFAVGTLMAAMSQADEDGAGLALGAWGAVQATATGAAMALGGAIRDGVKALASNGALGSGFDGTSLGYVTIYHLEILLLFATIAVIGPLARHQRQGERRTIERFGITESPG
ncbi:MAG: BCD family MFS transporter [Pseudomonadota bacterium]